VLGRDSIHGYPLVEHFRDKSLVPVNKSSLHPPEERRMEDFTKKSSGFQLLQVFS